MFYDFIAISMAVLGLLILLFGARLLFCRGWILGFVRGATGVVFIGVAASAGMVALDLRSYHQILQDKPIATISFEELSKQLFRATLVYADTGMSQEFELAGDQWQMDARVLRWKGVFRSVGGKPGYRLDRIGGRYISLDEERNRERTVYSLSEKEYGMDLWAWANESKDRMPWIDASYGSATFVPMVDGGLFEIALSNSGLVAKPLNSAAKDAVDFWQ